MFTNIYVFGMGTKYTKHFMFIELNNTKSRNLVKKRANIIDFEMLVCV